MDKINSIMKKLLILLFSIMISFNSYGEWTYIDKNTNGSTFYIELVTIQKHEDYIYYWVMNNYLKPDRWGDMSNKMYIQGDCGVNRVKILSYNFYKQPMGKGKGEVDNTSSEWTYPTPESINRGLLDSACDYVN
jgi:hypothetical protein